jgi:hypothetical protein
MTSRATLSERALHAGLAALLAGGTTWFLPFFPAGWPFLLGALCALAALWSPAAGLALALAVPVLPLGNASLGLALAYVALAVLWLALFRREPRSGLLFLVGPALGAIQGLALFPALVLGVRGVARRVALSAVAAATAAAVAGIRDDASLGLGRTSSPVEALDALAAYARARPELWILALVVAVATIAAPYARSRGLWGIAVWGAAYVAAALLAPGSGASAAPLVLWIWLAAALLARPVLRAR